MVSPFNIFLLKSRLAQRAEDYVFEYEYKAVKALHGGDNSIIAVMYDMPYHPKRDTIAQDYAHAIMRIMKRDYPQEYIPALQSHEARDDKKRYVQADMFGK